MQAGAGQNNGLAPQTLAFYQRTLTLLRESSIPFLIGGAYALERYTSIQRHTKDLDVFVRPQHCSQVLEMLAAAGYRTELTFPHWLGKAYEDEDFIDVIFGSGNGLCLVDDAWFDHAEPGEVLGQAVHLCPVEEILWSKGFIMERERYDGADLAHLLRVSGHRLDWPRVLERFGPHWLVLLNHLILFHFIYPAERDQVPKWIVENLLDRFRQERHQPPPSEPVCQGPLLSRAQYLIDVERWGYPDVRLQPKGLMSAQAIARWTAPIRDEKSTPR